MTSKQDFTDEEWQRIRRAPLVAGFAISIADPGGPIELAKETLASLRSATLPPSQEELLASVALDVQALAQQKQSPLGDFKPTNGQLVLDELRGVNELVTAKATPQEVDAFRGWLVATAQAAADAAKEGGFMGFRAERVSAGERQMLDQVRAALGLVRLPDVGARYPRQLSGGHHVGETLIAWGRAQRGYGHRVRYECARGRDAQPVWRLVSDPHLGAPAPL